jgi:subtilisin family serine protease
MNGDKFDKRLLVEIEAVASRGMIAGRTLAAIGQEDPIPVTITHPELISARIYKDRERTLTGYGNRFDEAQKPVLRFLDKIGAQSVEKLVLSNSISAELTVAQLQKLDEERELLNDIELVRLVKQDAVLCLHHSAQVIEARPYVWDGLNRTGKGIKVAVLDSGIDKNHYALKGKVVAEVSTVPSEGVDVPGDHGTHCAGIIASQNAYRRGVAHGADLINVKVLTSGGSGDHTWVEKGMELAFKLGADVVSMSLGWSHIYHGWQCDDGRCSLCRAAESLVRLGVVVVVAAGNEDNIAASRVPPVDTSLRCPGQCRDVITVGSVDNNKELAGSSSVGPPSYHEGWVEHIHFPTSLNVPWPRPGEPWWTKPDVCAPGVNIYSTVLNNKWDSMSGTSMATPHVAGVAALMLEQNPDLSPQMVKNLLKHTAESLKDKYSRFQAGDGVVNAYTAVLHS